MFRRAYLGSAILILNDYSNIEYSNTNFIDIAQQVKSAGAPIDAVGDYGAAAALGAAA